MRKAFAARLLSFLLKPLQGCGSEPVALRPLRSAWTPRRRGRRRVEHLQSGRISWPPDKCEKTKDRSPFERPKGTRRFKARHDLSDSLRALQVVVLAHVCALKPVPVVQRHALVPPPTAAGHSSDCKTPWKTALKKKARSVSGTGQEMQACRRDTGSAGVMPARGNGGAA